MDLPAVSTRRVLRERGLDDMALRRAVRGGVLVRVGYDRYARPGVALPAEVVAVADPQVALSHTSAARAWGLPADDASVHVVVPETTRRRALPAHVVVHRARRWEATYVGGLRVTSLARTLADVAATAPLEVGVPILDAGLRGTSREAVLAMIAANAPGRAAARRALDLADPRAESPLESRLRLVLTLAGLPPHDVQRTVRHRGRFVARVDLWYPGVAPEGDGFEFHRERGDYRRDRLRWRALTRAGVRCLPFAWEDVRFRPDAVVEDVGETLALVSGSDRAGDLTAVARMTPSRRAS